jgi:hypothetical protein
MNPSIVNVLARDFRTNCCSLRVQFHDYFRVAENSARTARSMLEMSFHQISTGNQVTTAIR